MRHSNSRASQKKGLAIDEGLDSFTFGTEGGVGVSILLGAGTDFFVSFVIVAINRFP